MDNKYSFIQNSNIHDYRVLNLIIDYNNASIHMELQSPQGVSHRIDLNNFLEFHISHVEPWGAGDYVASSEIIYDKEKKCIVLDIVFNSGDRLITHLKE